jgi:hypothetical protein
MPYIVITSKYPSDLGPQVAKRYLEAIKEFPSDDRIAVEIVPAAVKATTEGLNVIAIVEVKEGKLEEALKLRGSRSVMFQNIAGYEYSMDVYLKVDEALALIGMSMPK